MATETVIYVSLALVLLTRIYVFISPPDFLQEHQDPHYQEYHLYRQYHIRKQKKRPTPHSSSPHTDHDPPLLAPLSSSSQHSTQLHEGSTRSLTPPPFHTASSNATSMAAASSTPPTTATFPSSSPSSSSLLSTISQRNASTVTLSPPKEPTPLKPLSDAYATTSPPPPLSSSSVSSSSSSVEQYVLERFAHHAPQEELLLVGVGSGTTPLPASSLLPHIQQQDHHGPLPPSRRTTTNQKTLDAHHSRRSPRSSVDSSRLEDKSNIVDEATDNSDNDTSGWSEVAKDDSFEDRDGYYTRGRSQSLWMASPPLDPSPLSSLNFNTSQQLSPPLMNSSSPWNWSTTATTPCSPLPQPNTKVHNQDHSDNDHHHHDFEARMRSLMMALNLKSLKAPSYLSLPISEIQYSTSAAASISASTTLSSSSPLSPQSPSSFSSADAAITAQFDADPDLQAQLATFLHQYDSNSKNSNEFVETLRNQLLLQQDMAVVWESGRWCCLEDNANRLLYILRKIGWQGQVRVKVLVDRDVDVEVGADANGSNGERNAHPSSKLSSSAAAHVSWGPSVVAVTEESWKAAGMEGIMLEESKGAIGLPVVSPAGDGGGRGKEQQSQQQQDEDGVVSGEGSAADIADAAYSETATAPLKQEVAPPPQHGSPLILSSEEALDEKGAGVQQHHSHASVHRTTTQKSWSVPPPPHSAAVLASAAQRSRMTIRSRRRNHYHHRYYHHNDVLQNGIMSKEANAEVTLHHGSRHSSIRNRRQDRKHDHHHPHYYLQTLPNKTMWDEEQDTDADADDEVDLHEAYEDYSVGSDDDDILVDEEDEVDEEEREEDDEDDKSLEDTRLRHHRHRQWALQQQQPRRQKAYTRHPGIQRSHTFPLNNSLHDGYSASLSGIQSSTSSSSTSLGSHQLVPLSITVPPLSGLCSLGILEQPPSVDKSPNTSSTAAEWSLNAVAASKEE